VYSDRDTGSPTVSLSSVYIVAAIAANEQRHVCTIDMPGAYLNADMEKDVLVAIEPKLATLLYHVTSAAW
jgi:hypothetical protein